MIRRVIAAALIMVIIVVVAGVFGFRTTPVAVEPPHSPSSFVTHTTLYDGIPTALQFYLKQTVGRAPQVTNTALLWGTGQILYKSIFGEHWLPLVWQAAIDVERGYVWKGQIIWWKWPLRNITVSYDSGSFFSNYANSVAIDDSSLQLQHLYTHAMRIWLPSTLLAADVSWSRQSSWNLVMRSLDDDSLAFNFHSHTRALQEVVGYTCKDDTSLSEWRIQLSRWDSFDGITVPTGGALSWEGKPYYRFTVTGAAFNVQTDEWFAAINTQ